jgi:hypothetical protein
MCCNGALHASFLFTVMAKAITVRQRYLLPMLLLLPSPLLLPLLLLLLLLLQVWLPRHPGAVLLQQRQQAGQHRHRQLAQPVCVALV